MKRLLSVFLVLLCLSSLALVPAQAEGKSEDIVILYTNDVHSYIDGPLSYDNLAAMKKELGKHYQSVLLVDAGDHVQGTVYGSADAGKTVVELMNLACYDAAAVGNHEFDYGMKGFEDIVSWAEYPYLSANFCKEGTPVVKPYALFDCGREKIAFVGITTPSALTSTSPVTFRDDKGELVYSFSIEDHITSAVKGALAEGATKVIALGHVGEETGELSQSSADILAGEESVDAFIDGHSHSVTRLSYAKDKNGKEVPITQTGEYFNRVGMMVIDSETGKIDVDFIEVEELLSADGKTVTGYALSSRLYPGTEIPCEESVKAKKDAFLKEVDESLGRPVGRLGVTLDNYDEEGKRLVRLQETNSGDFAADALYYLFDSMGMQVDLAVMNAGGVRNRALTGEITYKSCKEIHSFGNVACLVKVKGQQILDMLEWGVQTAGRAENGGFLQVSGLCYTVNTAIPSGVKVDENGAWAGSPETYRAEDVLIYNRESDTWEALDLQKSYHLAGYNFTLRDGGDGFAMLKEAELVLDYVSTDMMVLARYVEAFENAMVEGKNSPLLKKYSNFKLDYSQTEGSGRITFVNEQPSTSVAASSSSPITGEPAAILSVLLCSGTLLLGLVFTQRKRRTL